jgi:hypothetical protein
LKSTQERDNNNNNNNNNSNTIIINNIINNNNNIIIMSTQAPTITNNNGAIVAFNGRPTNAVEQIMRRVVSHSSEAGYANQNTTLILWLYDNDELREELLHDWMVDVLNNTTIQDREHDEGLTSAKKKGKRTNTRAAIKRALQAINPTEKNSPIILEKFTFNVFSHYLTQRKNKQQTYLSKTSYSGIRSAFVHLYRMSGVAMEEKMKQDISQFMGGMKRVVASAKATNGQSLDEGKKAMTFDVYKKLCDILYRGVGEDYLFAHTFLTL